MIAIAVLTVTACTTAGAPGPTSLPASSTASIGVASATPTASTSPGAGTTCAAADLHGAITLWEGAAGSRIAHLQVTNDGAPCLLSDRLKPQLLDGAGNVLVDGDVSGVGATIGRGVTLQTLVEVSNYCGRAPVAPVTIGLVLTGRDRLRLAPPTPADVTVPPCNGPTSPASMQMRPWTS